MNSAGLDPEVELFLLRLSCVPGLGPVAQERVLAAWRAGRLVPSAFFELTAAEYRDTYRLRPAAVTALTERREESRRAAMDLLGQMTARGIDLVADETLPVEFPLLFAYGNLELREEPAAAILASTSALEADLAVAERAADVLARAGAHLVTGHNRPAYKAAGVAARRRGSPLTLVMDRGLFQVWNDEGWGREPLAPARVWDERFDREASLALSPFRLQDAWVTANARRRDQLVAAWAQVLVAVALRPGGRLEAECRAAVARGATVLLCFDPDSAGASRALLKLPGARVVAPEVAAEAALASLGPPGEGRRRAERRRRAAFARALAAAAGLPDGTAGGVRDLLPREDDPAFTYPIARGRRGAAAALILAEARPDEDLERAIVEWLGSLRPGGHLVAVLPGAFFSRASAAGFRQRLLAQGELLAAIGLPEGWGVCLFRKRRDPDGAAAAPALLLSPTARVGTAAGRQAYLQEALRRVRTALDPSANPPASAVPASSPPPCAAEAPSPG